VQLSLKSVPLVTVPTAKSTPYKSRVIKDMSKAEITTALKGYKDGSYGGPMKSLMKGQIAAYSDEQIDTLAAFIAAKK